MSERLCQSAAEDPILSPLLELFLKRDHESLFVGGCSAHVHMSYGTKSSSYSICIYIYAVELKTGPRFGVSSVKNWSKSSVENWSNFLLFFPSIIVFFGHF